MYLAVALTAMYGCSKTDDSFVATADSKGGIWVVNLKTGAAVRYCDYSFWQAAGRNRAACMPVE